MTRTERATSPRAILRDRFVNHNLIMDVIRLESEI